MGKTEITDLCGGVSSVQMGDQQTKTYDYASAEMEGNILKK